MEGEDTSHVAMRAVSKHFGAVKALDEVTLKIARGRIHALVGENGAGKSTLGKVIAGVHAADSGEVRVDQKVVRYRSPRDAHHDGVVMVAQELALVPELSVLANVFLGSEVARTGFRDERAMRRRYATLTERVGYELPAHVPVSRLRVADQQKVEILRALASDARLIIMDEPTAALSGPDTDLALDTVRALRERGVTIIYVSHFLDEVLALADDVSVMRDGKLVRTGPARLETTETLVRSMLGRSMSASFPPRAGTVADEQAQAPALTVTKASLPPALADVSLELHKGEILGVWGLVGSGRTELCRGIVGIESKMSGSVAVDGRDVRIRGPRDALRAGIALVPESRQTEGLVLNESIRVNVTLPHLPWLTRLGLVPRQNEARRVTEIVTALGVRHANIGQPIRGLSGGNQQKALFAKWLFRRPKVLIVDEPTRGVDVGSKLAIYELLAELAADGLAILVVSSETEEVLGLAHRILVMHRGRVAEELDAQSATETDLLQAAFASSGARA